ncbi:MAG TPA: peptidase M3, partial [Gemmata sp.]|nr:peptidase M3 [Gemmata sp.]
MIPDRRTFLLSGGATVAGLLTPRVEAADQPADAPAAAKEFIAAHEKKMKPLDVIAGIAWWDANVTGKDEDFKKKEEAQNRIDAALSDPKRFETLKGIKAARDGGKIADPIIARQV